MKPPQDIPPLVSPEQAMRLAALPKASRDRIVETESKLLASALKRKAKK